MRALDSNQQAPQTSQTPQRAMLYRFPRIVVFAHPAVELDTGNQFPLRGGKTFGHEEVEGVAFVEGEGVACVDEIARFGVDLSARLEEVDGEAGGGCWFEEGGDGDVEAVAGPVPF